MLRLATEQERALLSSCRFMAPEVLRSAVEPASDVWSAGVMAHQLLTGRFPFNDRSNPSNPAISKIWCAAFLLDSGPGTCQKVMSFRKIILQWL